MKKNNEQIPIIILVIGLITGMVLGYVFGNINKNKYILKTECAEIIERTSAYSFGYGYGMGAIDPTLSYNDLVIEVMEMIDDKTYQDYLTKLNK